MLEQKYQILSGRTNTILQSNYPSIKNKYIEKKKTHQILIPGLHGLLRIGLAHEELAVLI